MTNNNLEKLMALSKKIVIAANAYSGNALRERESLERLYSLMSIVGYRDEHLTKATLKNISYTIDKAEVVGKIFSYFTNALEAYGINNKEDEIN